MLEHAPLKHGQTPPLPPAAIDIETETLIPIRDVPARFPCKPSGKHVHISAVYRWMSKGVRGAHLESIRIGGTSFTSVEALQRFAERQTNATSNGAASAVTPRRRQQQMDAAGREVETILNRRPGEFRRVPGRSAS